MSGDLQREKVALLESTRVTLLESTRASSPEAGLSLPRRARPSRGGPVGTFLSPRRARPTPPHRKPLVGLPEGHAMYAVGACTGGFWDGFWDGPASGRFARWDSE